MLYPYSKIDSARTREVLTHPTAWMSLENFTVSGRIQTQKAMCYMISLYDMSRMDESIGTESRLVVARGHGGENGVTANGYRVSFWGNEDMFQRLGVVVHACNYSCLGGSQFKTSPQQKHETVSEKYIKKKKGRGKTQVASR
jgi:hypothetical protein